MLRPHILLFALGLFLAASPVLAQEAELEIPEAEEPLDPDDVRTALEDIIDGEDADPAEAISTGNPDIAIDALDIVLEPLTAGELEPEIAGWQALLRAAIEDLAAAEMELYRFNQQRARAAAQDAGISETDAEGDTVSPEKLALIDRISALREVRTARADRLRHVLDTQIARGGDPEDQEEVRAYIADVGGVRVDTQNLQTTMLTVQEWAGARDGGQRLLRNIGAVLLSTLGWYVLGWIIGLIVSRTFRRADLSSELLSRFLRKWIARIAGLLGFLFGLASIGVNMTPVLASIGAAGFILAFALQNTISNFANGILILFQRPFDAGDEIEAAGVTGIVEHVSLFSTHLSTAENRKVIIPNNMIWDDVVVNSTGTETRRLSIEIEVSADDHDLDEAEAKLEQIMNEHPDILPDPAPEATLTGVSAEAITFTCWPWVLTKDKDRMRRELVAQFGRELSVLKGVTKNR
ncbi:mechanosensitive ion channel family protein [Alterisphingorhabdus coralli]|uniref:Small-conductance mechanosensitive channel n=1 Tax=Alterisphingorhabdus coralli TaxID=3071408 RepID=A0AA97I256_9SPHN|nr:mechanosensitive ion channel domain-containing protein [Parasphingorhabdus sp. SCSIO 66989]WOE75440.1 mechanosensitive ion channel [Parasphingorhabdus sp. SCSIO 66989]